MVEIRRKVLAVDADVGSSGGGACHREDVADGGVGNGKVNLDRELGDAHVVGVDVVLGNHNAE